MPHFLVLYLVAATMVGLTALAVSVIGTIRSRVTSYWFLILFYAAFTADIATLFTREYLYVNIPGFSQQTVLMTYLANTLLAMLYMAAITLYYHRSFAVRFLRLRDGIVLAVTLLGGAALLLPNAVTLDAAGSRFTRNLPVLLSAGVFVAVFAYFLAVGGFGSKRDRLPRELLLIWASYAFGVVGFGESLLGFVSGVRDPIVVMSASGQGFMISTVPYALFGGVLIYYFGSFLVADARPPQKVAEDLARRFQISPREQEVILLLNQGLGNREIAQKLFVSLATVKTHVHNIFEKTGSRSRYELFRLLQPPDPGSS